MPFGKVIGNAYLIVVESGKGDHLTGKFFLKKFYPVAQIVF